MKLSKIVQLISVVSASGANPNYVFEVPSPEVAFKRYYGFNRDAGEVIQIDLSLNSLDTLSLDDDTNNFSADLAAKNKMIKS
jgi:hypothetical protein